MANLTPSPLIGVLYLGGTIGCAGLPLAPLPAVDFLPHLAQVMKREITLAADRTPFEWRYFSAAIKDSSALIPEDWADILSILLAPEQRTIQQWIILHGTDTLAYSAAFLAAALAGTRLNVIITGSQLPLLDPQRLTVCRDGDALANLQTSVDALLTATETGWVGVAFDRHSWRADHVQKIHTLNRHAFTGQTPLLTQRDGEPPRKSTAQRLDSAIPPSPYLSDLPTLKQRLATVNIQLYYASPLPRDTQVAQIIQVLNSGAEAVILLAYGLGNLTKDASLVSALLAAEQRGVMVVLTTQVPFGGVESRYAAGNWLKQCGVLSAEQMPVPAIFARLAWLHVTLPRYSDRRKAWLQGTIDR
jgi:L-asparaginase